MSKKNIYIFAALLFNIIFASTGCTQDSLHRQDSMHKQSSIPPPPANLRFSDKFAFVHDSVVIIGTEKGYSVFRTKYGQYFTIDPATGNMQFVSQSTYTTYPKAMQKKRMVRTKALQFNPQWLSVHPDIYVRILGVDSKGNVIEENSARQRFYLDPETGQMMYVK